MQTAPHRYDEKQFIKRIRDANLLLYYILLIATKVQDTDVLRRAGPQTLPPKPIVPIELNHAFTWRAYSRSGDNLVQAKGDVENTAMFDPLTNH